MNDFDGDVVIKGYGFIGKHERRIIKYLGCAGEITDVRGAPTKILERAGAWASVHSETKEVLLHLRGHLEWDSWESLKEQRFIETSGGKIRLSAKGRRAYQDIIDKEGNCTPHVF